MLFGSLCSMYHFTVFDYLFFIKLPIPKGSTWLTIKTFIKQENSPEGNKLTNGFTVVQKQKKTY